MRSTSLRGQLLASTVMLLGVTILLGFGYPLLVTGLSALFFRHQADGSLVYRGGKLAGSSLLGQNFTDAKGSPLPGYFQPRPSAAGSGYNAGSSGATNLGPSNPLLIGFVPGINTVGLDGRPSRPAPGRRYARNPDGSYVCDPNTVPERAIAYRTFNGLAASAPVPIDAVTASGSGLDPDISPQNALDQAPRVARARHLRLGQVIDLVHRYTRGRQWGFLGEPTVDVLDLNLALDRL